ncbi:coiled-coil domain-containing protein 50 isoform X1 [Aquila chrysaetos chrysaetos]|uniref:coiled-coil domain-containing protein 50 isoform X1 n=1 Tax=Aquila chrysaetos chrysaetos TaxID=223781 RepID=UPI001B7D4223|nr:coiled-coil domain-containing protein 50 isoform X1 [Aquila chrysaetos chrysaetos]
MAGIGIDHSKLPGVKEVCRDFAVLEDHTLAHNLQEQEIEHHLATNVQRNRLVQHDLQVAKQLQEEEDLKARAQIQKHRKDLERQDCEIAQEIQVKLVFEAEQRRRQEEKDEDIARLLQQKELQEEKKRKKHYPESQGHTVYEDSYYAENGEHPWGDPREQGSEPRRARGGDRHARQRREHREAPLPLSRGASEHGHSASEDRRSSPQPSEAGNGHRQEWKSASQGRSRRHPSLDLERTAERSACDYSNSWELRERRAAGREKAWRPLSLDLESEHGLADEAWHSRKPTRQDREKHLPLLQMELEAEQETWRQGGSQLVRPQKHKSRHQGHSSHRMVHDEQLRDAESRDDHRRGEERDCKRAGHRRHSPSPHTVTQGKVGDCRRDSGTKLRGAQQAMYDTPQREQELSDAEIARKLQEEELLANEADQKAAQVAQDEEIARLLMAEEKKAFKKEKEREKSSFEKRRHDQDWRQDASESTRSRSKEGPETQRHKGDRSSRSQPLLDDFEHARYYTSQPSPLRHVPRPEHSPKGSRRKQ